LPSDAAAAREVIDLLRTFSVESNRLTEAFAERHGMHHTDLRALLAVLNAEQRGEPLTPGELSAAVGLSSGSTTALIDRLERHGHLRRVRGDADRRRVRLHYDPAGLAVAQGFFGPLGVRSRKVMDEFTPGEMATVARFLRAMTQTITRYREDLSDPGSGTSATT
jgi:DNA-binding MarR family transcriptional regulator